VEVIGIHQLLVPTRVSEPLAVGSTTGLGVFFAVHYKSNRELKSVGVRRFLNTRFIV